MIISKLKKLRADKLKLSQLKDLYQKTVVELPRIYEFVHEHYDINKIFIVNDRALQMRPENSEDISVVSEDELMDLTMPEKSLIVTSYPIPAIEEQLLKKRIRLIDYTELVEVYRKHCSEPSDLPLVLNTIENAFEEIYVIGKNKTAGKVYDYLSANPNVNVFAVEIDDVIHNSAEKTSKDAVHLVVDFLPYTIEKYITTPVVHWRKIGTDRELMDGRRDIHDNILPKLRRGGVQVITVATPASSKIKWNLNLRMSIFHYEKIRQCNRTDFVEKTNQRFNTEKLTAEQLDVKTIRDKGYAEIYHNGCQVNYDNGFRRTLGNMASYQRRVWIFGPCVVLGSYVSDANTIPSIIQKELGDRFLVINRGQPNAYGLNLLMRSTEYQSGDIVLYIGNEGQGDSYDYDMMDSYRKVRRLSKHVSDSLMHCDSVVTNQVALDLVDLLRKKLADVPKTETVRFGVERKRAPEIDMIRNEDFVSYLNQIRPCYKPGYNGAIVMNCNPFTKGHLYLITEASRRVDNLYIFVVEEDKSFFPFEDRYALVKSGTAHLSNVQVLNSGKFAISSSTLPGYFEKDQLGDVYLDASSDLELFLQIAKALNISIRFAGHEPIDKFTAQYNLNMGKYLTKYGIEFCEIERAKDENEYISASRVRKLLKEGKLAEIKQLVPDCTYEYLKNRKEK